MPCLTLSLLLYTDYRANRTDLQRPSSDMAPPNSQTFSNFHLATVALQMAGTRGEMEGIVENLQDLRGQAGPRMQLLKLMYHIC